MSDEKKPNMMNSWRFGCIAVGGCQITCDRRTGKDRKAGDTSQCFCVPEGQFLPTSNHFMQTCSSLHFVLEFLESSIGLPNQFRVL